MPSIVSASPHCCDFDRWLQAAAAYVLIAAKHVANG